MGFAQVRNQLLATSLGNLMVLGIGIKVGWFSPVLPYLQQEDGPLVDGPLTTSMTGWIGAALALGSLCGGVLFGLLAPYLGFKKSILLTSIPITIGWLLIIFGDYSWMLLLSRFTSGMAIGGFYTVMPQYVSEIASDYIRGQMNSNMQIFCFTGILFGYIGGSYIPYHINPLVMITIPIISLVTFWFVPESPQYLLRSNQLEAAEKSLRFYRNCPVGTTDQKAEENMQAELDTFVAIAKMKKADTPLQLADFTTPIAIRTLLICPLLMIVNQFNGSFAITTYAVTVFNETGANLDAEVSSIIVAVLQVIATYVASLLIDRAGRKVLLLVSTGIGSLALIITATYAYLSDLEMNMDGWNWVPLASISLFVFISSIGILPVPYVMISEVLPPKIRGAGATICAVVIYVCQTIMLKVMPLMLETLQLYGSFYFFGGVMAFGFFFTIFVVTETKGMNLYALDGTDVEEPTPKNIANISQEIVVEEKKAEN